MVKLRTSRSDCGEKERFIDVGLYESQNALLKVRHDRVSKLQLSVLPIYSVHHKQISASMIIDEVMSKRQRSL
jgi:hypothetical protein